MQAWICARWGPDRRSLSTLERASYCAADKETVGEVEEARQVLRCLILLGHPELGIGFSAQMLQWALVKLDCAPGFSLTLQFGRALCRVPPAALATLAPQGHARLPLVMARHVVLGENLLAGSLSWRESLTLVVFALGRLARSVSSHNDTHKL